MKGTLDNINVAAVGNVTVDALSDALIEALGLSEVSSSGGSAFGTGTSLAVNATIATNLVQNSTNAKITGSQIGDDTTAVGGNVEVTLPGLVPNILTKTTGSLMGLLLFTKTCEATREHT